MRILGLAFGFMVCCSLALPCPASVLINGLFEDWPDATPTGWTLRQGSNPVGQTGADAIGGAGTSASFVGNGRLAQIVAATGSTPWQFNLDFAVEDLSAQTNPENLRTLNANLFYDPSATSGPRIHMRVNGVGDLQVYNGTWTTPAGLAGAVSLDSDVTTDPIVNHLTVTCLGQLPVPLYKIRVIDVDNNVSDSGLLRLHEGGLPDTGTTWQAVQFRSDMSAGDYVIDNASLTDQSWAPALSIVAQHLGNGDPSTTWSQVTSGGGSAVAGISNDSGTGIDAWQVNSSTTDRTFYRWDLTAQEIEQAMTCGWRLDAVLSVTDGGDPNETRCVDFVSPGTTGATGIGKDFTLNFGNDLLGNTIVSLRGADGGSYTLDSGGYHLFSMVYDPNTETASLFIDGDDTPILTGYTGYEKHSSFGDLSFVRFGALSTISAGAANYHFVQFSIVPEPGALLLLVMSLAGLCALRPRRRL